MSSHAPGKAQQANARWMLLGAVYAAGGAMLFACKGLLAKQLYALNVNFELLVCIRATIALPLFWWYSASREGLRSILGTPLPAIASAAVAGFLCYYIGALTDFYALTMIDASIERVLLFSYPAMVVLFTSLRARRWPSRSVVTAAAMAYAGIFFAIGGFDQHAFRANLLGAGLVLISALTYAIYFMIGEKYTRQIGSARYTLFAMSAAAVALLLHTLLRHGVSGIAAIPPLGWWWLILLGVLCMFVPALMQAEGMRRIGAQRGSVVSTMGPPTTVLLAWALLGERLSGWQIAGVVLIIASVLLLELRRAAPVASE
jgi:drug/metabolite transporter (DMT)-like permease